MPPLKQGETYPLTEETVPLTERMTSPPSHLSEAELITLMERHGIGTDASIATHINNICERNYVQIATGKSAASQRASESSSEEKRECVSLPNAPNPSFPPPRPSKKSGERLAGRPRRKRVLQPLRPEPPELVGLTEGWTRRAATCANAAGDGAGAGVLQNRCRPCAAACEVKHRETVRPYRQGTSAQGRRARSLPRELPTKVQLLCQEHSPNGHSLRSIILAADGGGQAVVQVRLIQPLPPAHRRPPAASVQQKH